MDGKKKVEFGKKKGIKARGFPPSREFKGKPKHIRLVPNRQGNQPGEPSCGLSQLCGLILTTYIESKTLRFKS